MSASVQASLFDDGAVEECSKLETSPVSREENGDGLGRLAMVVSELRRHPAPAVRVRLARELEEVAELIVREAIGEVRGRGLSWREVGAELGVPFQTLFRRFGSLAGPGPDPKGQARGGPVPSHPVDSLRTRSLRSGERGRRGAPGEARS